MTWLDIGNGWRNIYLLSSALQALALGALFCAHRLFIKRSRAACFFTGVAATPLIEYLWTLALALVCPQASKWIYIGVLPAASAICLLVMLLRRARRLGALIKRGLGFARRLLTFDRPALISLCFAVCIGILLLPVCVRFSISTSSLMGADASEYMGLAQRYCDDRDLSKLLEKDETEGHYRGHSHFPSLELYMSYGLMHTSGEEYGYPYDKPALTGDGLLSFYMVAGYLALLIALCRERKRWIMLGALLLNLVPNLVYSVGYAPRDIWRILALFEAMLYFYGLEPTGGGTKRYIAGLLGCFAVCFTVMSAHVVCFVVLPFIVVAWVIWRWLSSLMLGNRQAGRTLLSSIGLALSGAAGTVVAFLGNLWCYKQWGEFAPARLINTFTSAPWFGLYMEKEYKLDATTTHVSFLKARSDILMGYATPIGEWGFWLALIALVCVLTLLIVRRISLSKRQRELVAALPKDGPSTALVTGERDRRADIALCVLYASLLTLITLAPMSGLLDTKLYSFSGSFLKLQRYTLQWFMLSAVMICGAFAAFDELWGGIRAFLARKAGKLISRIGALRSAPALRSAWRALPAWLCAILCVLSFVKGTDQTGYSNSFYRYSRDVMENESILLDNSFRAQYGMLMDVAAHVPEDEKILITRPGYQYPLKSRGYVISSNPISPILNLPLEDIDAALKELNVAMVATEPSFWDDRYFGLSTLSDYLKALPEKQIVETEKMRLYLLDPELQQYVPEVDVNVEPW